MSGEQGELHRPPAGRCEMPLQSTVACVQPFRLQEDLVRRRVGEADDLVLDRGAIAGPALVISAPSTSASGARLARMISWPSPAVVRRDAGGDLRGWRCAVRVENGTGGSSPGPCISRLAQSMVAAVEPRRRAGLEAT